MSEALNNLIAIYWTRFGNDEELKRQYLNSIRTDELYRQLRNFGTTVVNGRSLWSSHFKNNWWYIRPQLSKSGEKVQLRDAIIHELKKLTIQNQTPPPSFGQIYELVSNIVTELNRDGIKGARQMTKYDIACFLSKNIGVLPEEVYIHQGVVDGAKALGLVSKDEEVRIPLSEVYKKCPELKELNDADHIENFLCLYKRMK